MAGLEETIGVSNRNWRVDWSTWWRTPDLPLAEFLPDEPTLEAGLRGCRGLGRW